VSSDAVLYPCVSLHSSGEQVLLNFGHLPFEYDIATHRAKEKAQRRQAILETKIDQSCLLPLVRSYLTHAGYHDTLVTLDQYCHDTDVGMVSTAMDTEEKRAAVGYPELRQRKAIRSHIVKGDIESCVRDVSSLCPGLLESNTSLMFLLHSQQLIELVRASRVDEAVSFVRSTMAKYKNHADVPKEDLVAILSILAYADTSTSPVAHFLEQSHRDAVADKVNTAIIKSLSPSKGLYPARKKIVFPSLTLIYAFLSTSLLSVSVTPFLLPPLRVLRISLPHRLIASIVCSLLIVPIFPTSTTDELTSEMSPLEVLVRHLSAVESTILKGNHGMGEPFNLDDV